MELALTWDPFQDSTVNKSQLLEIMKTEDQIPFYQNFDVFVKNREIIEGKFLSLVLIKNFKTQIIGSPIFLFFLLHLKIPLIFCYF